MMEQRLDVRWAMQWPAVFVTRAWGRLPCSIQDFCGGGALLAFHEPAPDEAGLERGDGLVLQLRGAQGTALQELRCRVAHRSPGLIGVSFLKPDSGTLGMLAGLARVGESDMPLSGRDRELFMRLRQETAQFLEQRLAIFHTAVLSRLGLAAQATRSQKERQRWQQALQQFRDRPELFRSRFELAWQQRLVAAVQGRAMAADDVHDVLLEDEAFADWLALKVMASRAESANRQALDRLQQALASALGGGAALHPFSPAALCDSFWQALAALKQERSVERAFCKAFEETLLACLSHLYRALQACFEAEGIVMPANAAVGESLPAARGAAVPAEAAPEEALPLTAEDLLALWDQPLPPQAVVLPKASSRELRRLWLQAQGVARERCEVVLAADAGWDQRLQALGTNNSPESWREAVLALAVAESRVLPPPVLLAAQVVDVWFGLMREQIAGRELARERLGLMELPVLRLLCRDDGWLEQPRHPVCRILDALLLLGDEVDADHAGIVTALTALRRAPMDAAAQAAVWTVLDSHLSARELRRRMQADRLLRQAAGEWRHRQAGRRVEEGLRRRLAGRSVPEGLLRCLEAGWTAYLEHCELRHGEDAGATRQAWQVLDEWLELGRNPDYRIDWKSLLLVVRQGTTFLKGTGQDTEALLAEVRQLTVHAEAQAMPGVARQALALVQRPPQKDPAEALPEPGWLSSWRARMGRLRRGDVVQLLHKGGDAERLYLVWLAEDGDCFVFADQAMQQSQTFSGRELATLFRNGHILLVEPGQDGPALQALEQSWQQLYRELIALASHDALTGLVNRQTFLRQLEEALDRAKRQRARHVLADINIDGFGVFNREQGQAAGDRFLEELGHMLSRPLKARSTVARLEGDSFAVLLEDCELGEAQQLLSLRLAELAVRPFEVNGVTCHLTASAGLVDVSYVSDSAEALLMAAGQACEQAKEQGGNRIAVYHPDEAEHRRRDSVMAWLMRLNQALEQNRLQLRCQQIRPVNPQRAAEEAPCHEILLGMRDAGDESLSPAAFVQAAERYHRMQSVDRWVIENTLRWLAENPARQAANGMFSINLSGHSLNDAQLPAFIIERLAWWKVPPASICFEVTEATAIANVADAADLIRELRKCGCRFALDDFGLGATSFSHFQHLPVDYVKVDGALIRELGRDAGSELVVRAINEIAHIMGRETIAESVESDDVLQQLAAMGVDYAQGYGIARPHWLDEL